MHVCFCSDEFPPETAWGGIATYVAEAACALHAEGQQVTVISCSADWRDRISQFGAIHVIRLGLGPAGRQVVPRTMVFPLRCAGYLRHMRRTNRGPDIVEYPDWLGQGVIRSGLPTVIRLHATAGVLIRKGDLPASLSYRIIARIEAAALRLPAVLLANSRRIGKETRMAFRLPNTREIGVVPCLVNTQVFCPAVRPAHAPLLLFVGRMDRAKGAPTFFAALAILVRRFPQLRCVVVGEGPGHDQYDRDSFQDRTNWLARDAAVAATVTFTGRLPREALPGLYQQASVVAVPSIFESFGYVALEAMACGRPVVVSTDCGICEIIEDGVTAAVIPPEDPAALADRIGALLDSPHLAELMGRNARDLVLDQCSERTVARQLVSFYERHLAQRG